jgi:hypothetical protein
LQTSSHTPFANFLIAAVRAYDIITFTFIDQVVDITTFEVFNNMMM